MENLKGKVVIITGGAAGIGGAITSVLMERGASVVAVDIDEEAGERKVKENPDKIAFLKGDISKESVEKEAIALTISRFGKVSGIINNGHQSVEKSILDHTDEDWALSINAGFYATLYFMKAAYPELKKSKGAIVNFGSGAAIKGNVEQASYVAAKEAIRGLSRVAANEWAEDEIQVNVISPLALTEGLAKWKETSPEEYEKVASKVPMKRFGDPRKDIAPAVVFLLSDDSRYMTGQTIMVDGGSTMLT
ncbi:MAG: SDR family oxidoreductase [Bacteroidales bacterium]|nr:SDR family oxidoreductase [Bacteroidales bacterium]